MVYHSVYTDVFGNDMLAQSNFFVACEWQVRRGDICGLEGEPDQQGDDMRRLPIGGAVCWGQ